MIWINCSSIDPEFDYEIITLYQTRVSEYIHNLHWKYNLNSLQLPITSFHPHAKLWYISYSHRNSSRITHSFNWLGIKSCPTKYEICNNVGATIHLPFDSYVRYNADNIHIYFSFLFPRARRPAVQLKPFTAKQSFVVNGTPRNGFSIASLKKRCN